MSFRSGYPKLCLPAIVLDDGRVLTQAAAILAWLADTHPESRLGPASARPLDRFELEEMLSYLTSEVHVAFGPFFAPSRYLDTQIDFDALRRKSLHQVAGHMATLDAILARKSFVLATRSVADAYLYVLVRWIDNLPGGIRPFPNLARFRSEMEQDAGVGRALAGQGMVPLGHGA